MNLINAEAPTQPLVSSVLGSGMFKEFDMAKQLFNNNSCVFK